MGLSPPMCSSENSVRVYEKKLPSADRIVIAVGRMRIILRDHRKLSAFEPEIFFPESQHASALITVPDLHIIVEMEKIFISPVMLFPFFSQKSKSFPSFRHPVIPEFHFGFFPLCTHQSAPALLLSFCRAWSASRSAFFSHPPE